MCFACPRLVSLTSTSTHAVCDKMASHLLNIEMIVDAKIYHNYYKKLAHKIQYYGTKHIRVIR